MSRIIIVVPCYNEASRLDVAAYSRFAAVAGGARLLFVNDGSTDKTLEVLQRLAARAPERIEVLDLPRNGGKAEAVRLGLLHAIDQGPDYAGFWDADLATPLDAVPDFVDVLDRRPDISMVFGSRIRLLGRHIERQPARHYLGRVFATVASLTLSLPVYDTQCGAKMFRATPDLRAVLERRFLTRWVFDVELIARAGSFGADYDPARVIGRIFELPLDRWEDVAGSKVRPRDFVKAIADLARIYFTHTRPSKKTFLRPRRAWPVLPAYDGATEVPAAAARAVPAASEPLATAGR